MTENPYQDLIDKEPDFFNKNAAKQGAMVSKGNTLKRGSKRAPIKKIIVALKDVEDPEIPVNIYDLGLIYSIDQMDSGDVKITMTLTTPNCPVAGEMPKLVAEVVSKVDGVGIVLVELTWTPKWNTNMMSEDAKLALDIF